jgi:phage FluMu protein Com
MASINCPYCKKELAKFPSRKTKCPHCNKDIYVRTNPSDQQQMLVTEQELEKIEREWKRYHAVENFKRSLAQTNKKYKEELDRTLLEI